jgi:hypothetical protein
MAKNKQAKKEDKKIVEVKPKGPKVDYTPKNAVPKKKQEVEKPAIVYYGEGAFTVTEEGATCSWNEGSRQLCLDAAQEMIEGYTQGARPALFNFAARAALIENAKELTNAEYQYFGGQVTMGSHMKRQRFWKFVSYIGNGRIPNDLMLYTGPRDGRLTAAIRATIMQDLVENIKCTALRLIADGQRDTFLFRVSHVIGWANDCEPVFEAAPHDYNPDTMKGYKSLKDWSTRP